MQSFSRCILKASGQQACKIYYVPQRNLLRLPQAPKGVLFPRKRVVRNKNREQLLVPRAYSDEAEISKAREELDQLEQERDEASAVAEVSAKRCKRLAEQIGRLNITAMEEVKQGKEQQARKTLEEKCHLQKKYDRLQAKSETNYALAAKLEEIIGQKQTELIAFMSKVGKLEFPSSKTDQKKPDVRQYTEEYPALGKNFQYSDSTPGFQSDKDLEKRFLELERQTLERMLSISQQQPDIFTSQKEEVKKEVDEGFPQWWTVGNDELSRGIFGVANIEDREQQAELLLKQLVNSRVMGQDPDLPRMMVLVRLCGRALNIDETNGRETSQSVVICSIEAARQIEQTIRTSMFQNAVRQCMDCLANNEYMEGIDPQKAAPAVLMGLACVLGLDWKMASNLCSAQVCSWMGQKLLDIGADIRKSPTGILLARDNSSIVQLIRVLNAISPPLNSEHLKNVREKVAGLLSYSELQAVSQMVAKITHEEKIRSVVRQSLGLN
eukprot:TRINITY_DN10743_c0_g1_i1.p1 TRINITY_DN10743_c0_g1~~TRINITY_DN10743_c0_g1_i1.p1  ORF type:complete len:524 (+),score=68.50 TRINITY_DN10743_c0_g1_i1:87-1574(+)